MMCTYYKRCVIIIRETVNTNTTGPCNSRGQTFFFLVSGIILFVCLSPL